MALNVKPTRSELINLKKRIKLSERGYKLLKMKRDGLILEFFKVLSDAKDLRNDMAKKYERAQQTIAIAETIEGSIGVTAAAFSASENPQIDLKSKNIMGVVVPKIESQ
ncbi:MAG TPA: V-type ATP synthase subunit D, partial [Methanocorpusculum sp.]|nr:V-type ATP synthase subunit D [Methanocorpusculum sp.]